MVMLLNFCASGPNDVQAVSRLSAPVCCRGDHGTAKADTHSSLTLVALPAMQLLCQHKDVIKLNVSLHGQPAQLIPHIVIYMTNPWNSIS